MKRIYFSVLNQQVVNMRQDGSSFVHFYLWSSCCVPGPAPGTGARAVNEVDGKTTSQWTRREDAGRDAGRDRESQVTQSLIGYRRSLDFILRVIGTIGRFLIAVWHLISAFWKITVAWWVENRFVGSRVSERGPVCRLLKMSMRRMTYLGPWWSMVAVEMAKR